ncbi:MAG: hypothetical protein ACOC8O_00490 [Natronomonas sp.]
MRLLPRPSPPTQRRLTRVMQAFLVGIVGYGLLTGRPKAITNGFIALAITVVPAILSRNYRLPLDPWLGTWITGAVFLHSLGSAGLYSQLPWWDHLTHAISASLVAGVGYTTVRAVDLHSDEINIPRRFFAVYLLVFVLAFGVLWELFEFGLDLVADATAISMPLAQHGLDDTIRDLIFNSIGALFVAIFGQAHLSGIAERVRETLVVTD